jgi:alpha-tubulin suppressor-like RCC1 family protein
VSEGPVVFYSGVRALASGADHVCGSDVLDGASGCWGRNVENQRSVSEASPFAAQIALVSAGQTTTGVLQGLKLLAGGDRHTCGVRFAGGGVCFGANDRNQSRNGIASPTSLATGGALPGISNAMGVAAGAAHSCFLLADGTLRCMGANTEGQLGTGDSLDRNAFVAPLEFP